MAQQGTIIPQSSSPSFPGCALSCTTLLQAQDVCMPPNVPQSTQTSYNQCFCSSPFLTSFATTADGVCMSECAIQTDRQLLQAWYNSFCAQVRDGNDPTTQTSSTPPATVTSTQVITSGTFTATANPTTSNPAGTSSAASHQNQSWIEGHWKWVLMLGIIAVGLIALAWLAVWLKRRHRRKLEALRAAASGFKYDPEKRPANDPRRSATPDLWGPHQMMQATQGYGYDPDIIEEVPSKGKKSKYRGTDTKRLTKEAVEIIEAESSVSARPSTKRARPSELEINARMIGAADRRSKNRGTSSLPPIDKEMVVTRSEPPRSKLKQAHRDIEQT